MAHGAVWALTWTAVLGSRLRGSPGGRRAGLPPAVGSACLPLGPQGLKPARPVGPLLTVIKATLGVLATLLASTGPHPVCSSLPQWRGLGREGQVRGGACLVGWGGLSRSELLALRPRLPVRDLGLPPPRLRAMPQAHPSRAPTGTPASAPLPRALSLICFCDTQQDPRAGTHSSPMHSPQLHDDTDHVSTHTHCPRDGP